MNKVLIVGRIVRKPEIFITNQNLKYARFSIAVNRNYNREQTDFIPMIAWRQTADFIDKYIDAGSLVSIDGFFSSSKYTNNEGKNITKYEVSVNSLETLESKKQVELRRKMASQNQTNFDDGISIPNEKARFNSNETSFNKTEDNNVKNIYSDNKKEQSIMDENVPWESDDSNNNKNDITEDKEDWELDL